MSQSNDPSHPSWDAKWMPDPPEWAEDDMADEDDWLTRYEEDLVLNSEPLDDCKGCGLMMGHTAGCEFSGAP